jgi:hypothetical protein
MIFPPLPLGNYSQILIAQEVVSKLKPYAPVAANTGGDTYFEGRGAFVCQDAFQWSKVWGAHNQSTMLGTPGRTGDLNPPPAVDFDKNLVVALFAGPVRRIVGYRVLNGYALGDQAVLRIAPVLSNANATNVAVLKPWSFLVLPRTKANLEIRLVQDGRTTTLTTVKASL